MTLALRWAAMRAILMFINCEGQSHKTVSTDHNFWRERRAEADSNRGPSAYQPSALPPNQTGSRKARWKRRPFEWPGVTIRSVECQARGKQRVASSRSVQPASPTHGQPQIVTTRDCKASCGLGFACEALRSPQDFSGVQFCADSTKSPPNETINRGPPVCIHLQTDRIRTLKTL